MILLTYITLLSQSFFYSHITLFEELELLKEFEKRETTFITRHENKKTERKELDKKVRYTNISNNDVNVLLIIDQ